jgi:hypothetical protein
MEFLTFLIAIAALVIAVLAFQRTGGIHDLRKQMEDLSEKSEQATKGARDLTADALGRFESFIRGQDKSSSPESSPEKEEPKSPSST